MSFLVMLLGSKLGRYVALGGLIALGVLLLIARIYAAGRAKERARQLEQSLQTIRERVKKDDEITRLPPDQRAERLNRWVSGGR